MWHPINGEEVYKEDGRMKWLGKRCKSFVTVLMCGSWRTVTRVRISVQYVLSFGVGLMNIPIRHFLLSHFVNQNWDLQHLTSAWPQP